MGRVWRLWLLQAPPTPPTAPCSCWTTCPSSWPTLKSELCGGAQSLEALLRQDLNPLSFPTPMYARRRVRLDPTNKNGRLLAGARCLMHLSPEGRLLPVAVELQQSPNSEPQASVDWGGVLVVDKGGEYVATWGVRGHVFYAGCWSGCLGGVMFLLDAAIAAAWPSMIPASCLFSRPPFAPGHHQAGWGGVVDAGQDVCGLQRQRSAPGELGRTTCVYCVRPHPPHLAPPTHDQTMRAQVISHWTRTHAVVEPFIISTRRCLSAMHPIGLMLQKHFLYTLQINAVARGDLIKECGIVESAFTCVPCLC